MIVLNPARARRSAADAPAGPPPRTATVFMLIDSAISSSGRRWRRRWISRIERRVPGGQIRRTAGLPGNSMSLRIGDVHHHPLAILISQGVFHSHATIELGIA